MPETITTTELENHYQQAFNWQQRRHSQWTENYELYRDLVVVNRLLQRQSTNIPLMKVTVRTLLAKLPKFIDLVFEDRGNDKQKEIFKNALWEETVKDQKLRLKDVANLKQCMLYGRSFWKMGVTQRKFWAEVIDPQDILIDRYADPADIEGTANVVIHQHIFKTLNEVAGNPLYNKGAITDLKLFYAGDAGLIRSEENAQAMAERNQRASDLGVPDVENPVLGTTIVELKEFYVRRWDKEKENFEWRLCTKADNIILCEKPLMEVLGVNFLPLVTWAEDVERTDIWSDGVADIIRTINKVLNVWFSQLIENRTLRSFGMNYYDATAKEDWSPNTMDAVPFGWYPLPGKPEDVFQKVDIPDLSESLDEMTFLITMAEQATAATATQKGTSEKSDITLGEVKMMLVESQDRIADMAEPRQLSWLEFGDKWSQLIEANADQLDSMTAYKKGFKGNVYKHEIKPTDWQSPEGYGCVVKSAAEQEKDQINSLQKMMAVKAQFPMNLPLKRIVDNKLLDLIKLTPEETREVLEYEENLQKALPPGMTPQMIAAGGSPPLAPMNASQGTPGQIQPQAR